MIEMVGPDGSLPGLQKVHFRLILQDARKWRNLADAPDLGSGGLIARGGSSPPFRTIFSIT